MSQFTSSSVIYGADIVGTSGGATAIITLPNGYAINGIQLVGTNISGVITGPTFSIGTNSPNYNNVVSLSLITSLSAANNLLNINLANPSQTLNYNDTIYLNVAIAALATHYNFQIILLGYPI